MAKLALTLGISTILVMRSLLMVSTRLIEMITGGKNFSRKAPKMESSKWSTKSKKAALAKIPVLSAALWERQPLDPLLESSAIFELKRSGIMRKNAAFSRSISARGKFTALLTLLILS